MMGRRIASKIAKKRKELGTFSYRLKNDFIMYMYVPYVMTAIVVHVCVYVCV